MNSILSAGDDRATTEAIGLLSPATCFSRGYGHATRGDVVDLYVIRTTLKRYLQAEWARGYRAGVVARLIGVSLLPIGDAS